VQNPEERRKVGLMTIQKSKYQQTGSSNSKQTTKEEYVQNSHYMIRKRKQMRERKAMRHQRDF